MVAELERSWNSSSCYSQCKFAAMPIRPAKNKHKIAVQKSVCTIQGDFWKIGRASPLRPRPKKSNAKDAARMARLAARFMLPPLQGEEQPKGQSYNGHLGRSSLSNFAADRRPASSSK